MQKIILKLKDDNKLNFLLELLNQFQFIEVEKPVKKNDTHDFFASAGLWRNRDITAGQLRDKAWKRKG
jgi:hypothetical protein